MKRGALKPTPKDASDNKFAFHKHFGVATSFPSSYFVDNELVPDQNADRRPSGCTSYTIVDICNQEDKIQFSHDYQFMKTLEVENEPPDTSGADARTAFKIPCTFGLLPKVSEPTDIAGHDQATAATPQNWPVQLDSVAKAYVKPSYLPIQPVPDFFDGIRSAIMLGESENRAVGMATQWSPSFESLQTDAVLPDKPMNLYWGHMYECVGWETKYGMPMLKLKTWQGKEYGENGYCYMSRTLCNKLMGTWGAYAASIEKLPTGTVDELKNQRNTFIEVIVALIQNLIGLLKYQLL